MGEREGRWEGGGGRERREGRQVHTCMYMQTSLLQRSKFVAVHTDNVD